MNTIELVSGMQQSLNDYLLLMRETVADEYIAELGLAGFSHIIPRVIIGDTLDGKMTWQMFEDPDETTVFNSVDRDEGGVELWINPQFVANAIERYAQDDYHEFFRPQGFFQAGWRETAMRVVHTLAIEAIQEYFLDDASPDTDMDLIQRIYFENM